MNAFPHLKQISCPFKTCWFIGTPLELVKHAEDAHDISSLMGLAIWQRGQILKLKMEIAFVNAELNAVKEKSERSTS